MYLRFHDNSITFPERRRGQQLKRADCQDKRTGLYVIRSNRNNVHYGDRLPLRPSVRQAKYLGVYLPVLVCRLIDCDELQRLGLGVEGDHLRWRERACQLANLGLHIQRDPMHHDTDELSEQIARPVRHVGRDASLLRLLHDPGDNSVRDFVQGMDEDERGEHSRCLLRFSRSYNRHILVERLQGDGRALR